MSLVVFDLDGTIAMNHHRAHFVRDGNNDWDAFFEACDKDTPNEPVIDILFALDSAGFDIEIWSGRSDTVREKTEIWLLNEGLAHYPLLMRPAKEFCPDTELKKSWLDAREIKPVMVFDDRNSVVAMWRENGIICLQVAEGDF